MPAALVSNKVGKEEGEEVKWEVREVNSSSDLQLGKLLMSSSNSQNLVQGRSQRDGTARTTLPAASLGV